MKLPRAFAMCVLLGLALPSCRDKAPAPEAPLLNDTLPGKADVDPAAARALEDPILVDPTLTGQANRGDMQLTQPPQTGAQPYDPARPNAAAERPNGPRLDQRPMGAAGCEAGLTYDLDWANRWPLDLPIVPDGQLVEAAGRDAAACQLRAATFTSRAAPADILAFYRAAGQKAGYQMATQKAGRETWVRGGRGDAAGFFLVVAPGRASGSLIDLITHRVP
ncbi:MAG: hypothetical protein ACKOXK_00430 [Chakrabartia sp.]